MSFTPSHFYPSPSSSPLPFSSNESFFSHHFLLFLTVLYSKEGDEFIASRDCVLASGTIRAMLTGPGNILIRRTTCRSIISLNDGGDDDVSD